MPNLTDEQRDKLREIGRLMKDLNIVVDAGETYTKIWIDGHKFLDSRAELFEINGDYLTKLADSDKGGMMSNVQWPSFKDNKGNVYRVIEISFHEEYPNTMCEIITEQNSDDPLAQFDYFGIYSDGRFLHAEYENEYIPEKSAFYNAVIAMFNLGD